MVRVVFTAHLSKQAAGAPSAVPAGSLREVLESVFAAAPTLRGYVLDDQGSVRKHVAIFIAAQPIADRAALSDVVRDGEEVFVAQALSGG